MFEMLGISKRTAAAFAAIVVLLPLLVFVDTPAATAHDLYHYENQQQQRCAYDPFAGNQCWTETVKVRVPSHHSHPPPQCPTGTTGTPPDCYPIPPANDPVPTIPTIPDVNDPNYGEDDEPEDTTPPTTAAPTTAPPTTAAPPPCYWPDHSHGTTCHAWHGEAPCGTGTWSPHSGHTPVQRPPCPTTPPDDDNSGDDDGDDSTTTVPTECPDGEHRHALETLVSHVERMSDCHPAVANGHCPEFQHEHVHGSGACHPLSVNGTSHSHCPRGHHQHSHGESDCHHKDTQHCEDGEHSHGPGDPCHDIRLHPYIHEECTDGQHNHRGLVFPEVKGCHDESTQHNTGDLTRTEEFVFDATGEIICYPAGGAVFKAAKLVAKGAAWLKRLLSRAPVEQGIKTGSRIGCDALYDRLVTEEVRQNEAEKKKEHDELDDSDTLDSNSEQESPATEGPPRTPTTEGPPAPAATATAPIAVGSVTSLGGSAIGGSVWLGWNAPANGPAPTAYRVLRTAAGGSEQEVARVGGNAYRDSNVQSGVTYTYRVQPISGTLTGPISASAIVTVP